MIADSNLSLTLSNPDFGNIFGASELSEQFSRNLEVAFSLQESFNDIFESLEDFQPKSLVKRSDKVDEPIQTVYQPKRKKCKNVKSHGVAAGSNAVSYMSFVGAVITLVLNINNNINANNNNNNRFKLNFGKNSNSLTNLNQNVGNNFNLMFPPGRRRKRGSGAKSYRSRPALERKFTAKKPGPSSSI